jgi:hypothetical protein
VSTLHLDFFPVLILNRFEMTPPNAKHPLVDLCAEFPNGEVTVNGFKKDFSVREHELAKRSRYDEDIFDIGGDIDIEEMQ